MRLLKTIAFLTVLAAFPAFAQDTPTPTATATATPTPTWTPISSSALLAILDVTTTEQSYIATEPHPQIELHNLGPGPAYIKLDAGVTAGSLTPTPTTGQYYLAVGQKLLLGQDTKQFWYKAVSGSSAVLSLVVRQ